MLKLLDILVQLDHLKNAKASIPNDFSWYKRYIYYFALLFNAVQNLGYVNALMFFVMVGMSCTYSFFLLPLFFVIAFFLWAVTRLLR